MGIKWKKILKVVAIVAVVAAVAWFAPPMLGAVGEAITAGMTAIGEAVSAGFAAAGEALGFGATVAEGAGTAAAVAEGAAGAATAAEGAGALATAAEGAGAIGAADTALMADVGMGAAGAAEGGAAAATAAETAAAAAPAATEAATAATSLAAPTANDVALMAQLGGNVTPVTASATEGMLGQAAAWVKDNPLVASTLMKGVGGFASSLAEPSPEDKAAAENKAKMEYEDWQRQRSSDSITGMQMPQYTPNAKPRVLRRLDGSLVYTTAGGVPNGALARVMPGYGQPTPGG